MSDLNIIICFCFFVIASAFAQKGLHVPYSYEKVILGAPLEG